MNTTRPLPVVGTEYVYGTLNDDGTFTPLCCNGRFSPAHPCRVIPTKVGPKWSRALLSGSDNPKPIATDGLLPVDEAKARYRAGLSRLERDPKFVDAAVAAL